MRSNPHLVYIAIFVGVVAIGLNGLTSNRSDDREAMLGTWTDEAGPPGNSIRFFLVPTEIPGAPFASALEGHATLVNFLDLPTAHGGWNYGSWDPLVLNFWAGNQIWYVAIRKLDDDHLVVRFGDDPSAMMEPDALVHPETKRLTRVAAEPKP